MGGGEYVHGVDTQPSWTWDLLGVRGMGTNLMPPKHVRLATGGYACYWNASC